jgi:methyltransferase
MSQMLGVDSRALFVGLVALVAVQRLVELSVSRRNLRRALARGGVEHGARLYPWIVTVHGGLLLSGPAEVLLLSRPWIPALGATMAVLLVLAQALRYWTIGTLGERWTTRVIYVPGDPLVVTGPYRWIRHPNYAAIVMEFIALPLFHAAWMTAAAFSLANAVVLRWRIAVEGEVLRRCGRRPEDGQP